MVPSIFLNGDHTEQLYSKEGRRRERYAVSLSFDGQLLRSRVSNVSNQDVCFFIILEYISETNTSELVKIPFVFTYIYIVINATVSNL